METITFFTLFVKATSRQISSLAKALPPGLFIRKTTVLIDFSFLTSLKSLQISKELKPSPSVETSPSAKMTAIEGS